MPLQIIRQDITKVNCDAIVNPSNRYLYPSGGADLAINKAAGEKLYAACKEIGGVETGKAVITPGFDLPCKFVIHTSGPYWEGGGHGERELLISCYKSALLLAKENGCESIAFPLISSGVYGYPKDQVLKLAINTISEFLFQNEMMVYLVVFDKKAYQFSEKLFSGITSYIDDYYVLEHSDNERDRRYITSLFSEESEMCSTKESAPAAAEKASCFRMESAPANKLSDIEDFIKLDEGFSVKLLKLIDAKGISDVECYKKANVSKQTWYKIMNDKHYKPNKKTVISFAVALELTLDETQSLLASVGFILSNSSLFDVIIMYCISNGIYSVLDIDSVLFSYDQETLYSKL
ncbi:MAG: macro domain-containing protein [Ruminiclostridium sp.]